MKEPVDFDALLKDCSVPDAPWAYYPPPEHLTLAECYELYYWTLNSLSPLDCKRRVLAQAMRSKELSLHLMLEFEALYKALNDRYSDTLGVAVAIANRITELKSKP